jgi:hypothetical protein
LLPAFSGGWHHRGRPQSSLYRGHKGKDLKFISFFFVYFTASSLGFFTKFFLLKKYTTAKKYVASGCNLATLGH